MEEPEEFLKIEDEIASVLVAWESVFLGDVC